MIKRFEVFYIFAVTMAFVVLVQSNILAIKSYSTCTVCMAAVLDLEQELMLNLQKYKEDMQYKLKLIRFSVSNLQRNQRESELDPEGYLSNPLKAFALIRRMYSDWIKWLDYMKQPSNNTHIDFIEAIQNKMPTSYDLQEACAGIVRIQNTYQMKAEVMSSGILNHKQYEKRLSAQDCYVIGDYLFNATKYVPALDWFNASLDRYAEYDTAMSDVFGVDRINIWKYIALSHFEMGDTNATAYAVSMALKYKTSDEALLTFLNEFRGYLECNKLCRGEIPQKSKLFCRYNSTTTPFLKIAPLKMEEVSIDPYVVLYHDIIYESEIKELKRKSPPKFERSTVGYGSIDPDRTAQILNLVSNDTLIVDRINQRLFDMSGLFLSEEKALQVINYGIGGHYLNHLDYFTTEIPENFANIGNRIATVLIYLNDVEKGGETAFSDIKKVIHPKKGTAVFWHHLDNSGNGISETIHASCPVLVGSKWLALRFIHYYPQLFIKPCYK